MRVRVSLAYQHLKLVLVAVSSWLGPFANQRPPTVDQDSRNLLFRGRMAITNAVSPAKSYFSEVEAADSDATLGREPSKGSETS